MNIQQIKYAIAVAEVQSFGKAAEKCFITQSTLSTMISRLEDELGLQLFDRKKKPITTTKEGEAILQQLRIINKELETLDEVVGDLKGESTGQLNIGVIPTVAPYLLPLFLNDFVQKHPNIKFIISEMTTDNIIEGLEHRNLDIGILSTPLQHNTLIEKPLYNEPFLLFDKTKKYSNKNVKVSEIDCNRLWLLNEGHCLRTQVETICNLRTQRDDHWNLEYKSGTIDTLMKFVRKNHAITLLPYLATLDLSAEDLNYVHPIAAPQPAREISLVVHQHFVKKSVLISIQNSIQEVIKPLFSQQKLKKWLVAPV
ncbi:MAG: LysR family transcriptional regulator [Aureispira sp.]|nr:LysR family transcriptional regulator [Aureispira sp.]